MQNEPPLANTADARAQERREPPDARLAAETATFDLAKQFETLRGESAWQDSDRNAKTLIKKPDLRVVLIAMKAGAVLERHKAPGPITIHALSGKVRVDKDGGPVDLVAGQLLSLDRDIPHDLKALEPASVLLTVAWPAGNSGTVLP